MNRCVIICNTISINDIIFQSKLPHSSLEIYLFKERKNIQMTISIVKKLLKIKKIAFIKCCIKDVFSIFFVGTLYYQLYVAMNLTENKGTNEKIIRQSVCVKKSEKKNKLGAKRRQHLRLTRNYYLNLFRRQT